MDKPNPSYSRADRWLHRLALGPASVRQLAFDLDRHFALPDEAQVTEAASGSVYVCGLARSGTTLVLRLLDQLDDFRSLTYRDMPFPLAPNLWRRVAGRDSKEAFAAPRAHGDGMLVDFDSPEGFEEVFWRTCTRYTTGNGTLWASQPTADAIRAFVEYRALVANPRASSAASRRRRRYLSKNNNHLLRLGWLSGETDGRVILVYRNPVAAAQSMHATHVRFLHQHRDDYTRQYMRWLCHFEFGMDHVPFHFAKAGMAKGLDPARLDYWLDYWCAVHEYILEIDGPALRLLDYDALCSSPSTVMRSLFDAAEIEARCDSLSAQVGAPRHHASPAFDALLTARADAVHVALRRRPDNVHAWPQ